MKKIMFPEQEKKNHNTFAKTLSMKGLWLLILCWFASAAGAASLNGLSYNTIQKNQIELVFSLSEAVSTQPEIKTFVTRRVSIFCLRWMILTL